jgi:hypothetical protein
MAEAPTPIAIRGLNTARVLLSSSFRDRRHRGVRSYGRVGLAFRFVIGIFHFSCNFNKYSISTKMRVRTKASCTSRDMRSPGARADNSRWKTLPHTGISRVPCRMTCILPSITS